MAIPDYLRTNFQTLLRAAGDGNLALMECQDAQSGEPRFVICAVGRNGSDYVMTPSVISWKAIPMTPTSRRSDGRD